MDLIDIIKSRALEHQTPELAHQILHAQTIEKRDSARLTLTDLFVELGEQTVLQWFTKLKGTPYESLSLVLISGVDFSKDQTQRLISQLEAAGVLSAEDATKARELGLWYESPLEAAGFTGDASLEAVTAALVHARSQAARETLLARVNEAALTLTGRIQRGEIADWAGVLKAAETL